MTYSKRNVCPPNCKCGRHLPHARTHGYTGTPEHSVWKHIRQRCLNPNDKSFPDYGGRGIKICDRWLASFENFFEDMGKRPARGYSIERINNDGDYCPENCIWAKDRIIQNNNTRKNVFLTHNGQTMTVTQWARHIDIPAATLWKRIQREWSTEDALTLPVNMIATRHYRQAAKFPTDAEGSLRASQNEPTNGVIVPPAFLVA